MLGKVGVKELFSELAHLRDDVALMRSIESDAGDSICSRVEAGTRKINELEKKVESMTAALPHDRWAVALSCRILQGMSVAVVAKNMGVSTSSVYSYISNAAK